MDGLSQKTVNDLLNVNLKINKELGNFKKLCNNYSNAVSSGDKKQQHDILVKCYSSLDSVNTLSMLQEKKAYGLYDDGEIGKW